MQIRLYHITTVYFVFISNSKNKSKVYIYNQVKYINEISKYISLQTWEVILLTVNVENEFNRIFTI